MTLSVITSGVFLQLNHWRPWFFNGSSNSDHRQRWFFNGFLTIEPLVSMIFVLFYVFSIVVTIFPGDLWRVLSHDDCWIAFFGFLSRCLKIQFPFFPLNDRLHFFPNWIPGGLIVKRCGDKTERIAGRTKQMSLPYLILVASISSSASVNFFDWE